MRHQRLRDALTPNSRHRLLPVEAGENFCFEGIGLSRIARRIHSVGEGNQFVRREFAALRWRAKQGIEYFRLLVRWEPLNFADDFSGGHGLFYPLVGV